MSTYDEIVGARLIRRSVIDESTGCRLWSGGKTADGYGKAGYKGQSDLAHRVAYQVFKGPIDSGLCVLHRCDTPACINPEHLKLGTHADNVKDRDKKNRQQKGEAHYCAKLLESDVKQICVFLRQGRSQQKIANQYGVTQTQISCIKLGRAWSWLTGASRTHPIIRSGL